MMMMMTMPLTIQMMPLMLMADGWVRWWLFRVLYDVDGFVLYCYLMCLVGGEKANSVYDMAWQLPSIPFTTQNCFYNGRSKMNEMIRRKVIYYIYVFLLFSSLSLGLLSITLLIWLHLALFHQNLSDDIIWTDDAAEDVERKSCFRHSLWHNGFVSYHLSKFLTHSKFVLSHLI